MIPKKTPSPFGLLGAVSLYLLFIRCLCMYIINMCSALFLYCCHRPFYTVDVYRTKITATMNRFFIINIVRGYEAMSIGLFIILGSVCLCGLNNFFLKEAKLKIYCQNKLNIWSCDIGAQIFLGIFSSDCSFPYL